MKLRPNLSANRARYLRGGRQSGLVFCDVEVRFVKRQRLDQIGMAPEDFARLTRHVSVAGEIRRQEHRIGTETFRSNSRHRRTHAKLSCFVGGGANDRAIPAPRDRLAPQLRIVALLDGRIKRVHVDMNDLAPRRSCRFAHRPPSYSTARASVMILAA